METPTLSAQAKEHGGRTSSVGKHEYFRGSDPDAFGPQSDNSERWTLESHLPQQRRPVGSTRDPPPVTPLGELGGFYSGTPSISPTFGNQKQGGDVFSTMMEPLSTDIDCVIASFFEDPLLPHDSYEHDHEGIPGDHSASICDESNLMHRQTLSTNLAHVMNGRSLPDEEVVKRKVGRPRKNVAKKAASSEEHGSQPFSIPVLKRVKSAPELDQDIPLNPKKMKRTGRQRSLSETEEPSQNSSTERAQDVNKIIQPCFSISSYPEMLAHLSQLQQLQKSGSGTPSVQLHVHVHMNNGNGGSPTLRITGSSDPNDTDLSPLMAAFRGDNNLECRTDVSSTTVRQSSSSNTPLPTPSSSCAIQDQPFSTPLKPRKKAETMPRTAPAGSRSKKDAAERKKQTFSADSPLTVKTETRAESLLSNSPLGVGNFAWSPAGGAAASRAFDDSSSVNATVQAERNSDSSSATCDEGASVAGSARVKQEAHLQSLTPPLVPTEGSMLKQIRVQKETHKPNLVAGGSQRQSSFRRWTEEEDAILREAVIKHDGQHWKLIAEMVPSRDHVQCLQRWKKVLRPGLMKGAWQQHEDELLCKLINEPGITGWAGIAKQIPGRTPKQCRERWSLSLDPSINRAPWTEAEDRLLIEMHEKYGNSWAEIRHFFDNRTENAIKTRANCLLRAMKRDSTITWTDELILQLRTLGATHNNDLLAIQKHLPRSLKGISASIIRKFVPEAQ